MSSMFDNVPWGWTRWFAWYPVKLGDYRDEGWAWWVWLERFSVETGRDFWAQHDHWTYRRPK
jgi:hypothetical protein